MFLSGIDYQYCKGCLKCVQACPVDALTTMREEIGYAEEHRVPQKFILATN
jgi:pyruvate ferredoxin oxidoreductase gamma subunit